MRVLLDECLPKRLASELAGHEVSTVSLSGWAGLRNGELLRRIAGRFGVFVTIDGNLAHQQPLAALPFAVIVLKSPSNKIEDLRPLVPRILSILEDIQPGQVQTIG